MTSILSLTLSAKERIRKREDFTRIFSQGRRVYDTQMILLLLPRSETPSRIGLAVGKKTGNAPRRNRIKRLLREAYRKNKHLIQKSHDLVFLPRPQLGDLTLSNMEQVVTRLINKSGLCDTSTKPDAQA